MQPFKPTQNIHAVLTIARALIADKHRWACTDRERTSDKLCALDAVSVACGATSKEWWDAVSALHCYMGHNVAWFNDTHSHAEVLQAFDRTLAHIEAAR